VAAGFVQGSTDGADLSSCNFTNAVLISADFFKANLSNAIFTGADCKGANFSLANLRGAKVAGMKNTDLMKCAGAIMPDGTVLKKGKWTSPTGEVFYADLT